MSRYPIDRGRHYHHSPPPEMDPSFINQPPYHHSGQGHDPGYWNNMPDRNNYYSGNWNQNWHWSSSEAMHPPPPPPPPANHHQHSRWDQRQRRPRNNQPRHEEPRNQPRSNHRGNNTGRLVPGEIPLPPARNIAAGRPNQPVEPAPPAAPSATQVLADRVKETLRNSTERRRSECDLEPLPLVISEGPQATQPGQAAKSTPLAVVPLISNDLVLSADDLRTVGSGAVQNVVDGEVSAAELLDGLGFVQSSAASGSDSESRRSTEQEELTKRVARCVLARNKEGRKELVDRPTSRVSTMMDTLVRESQSTQARQVANQRFRINFSEHHMHEIISDMAREQQPEPGVSTPASQPENGTSTPRSQPEPAASSSVQQVGYWWEPERRFGNDYWKVMRSGADSEIPVSRNQRPGVNSPSAAGVSAAGVDSPSAAGVSAAGGNIPSGNRTGVNSPSENQAGVTAGVGGPSGVTSLPEARLREIMDQVLAPSGVGSPSASQAGVAAPVAEEEDDEIMIVPIPVKTPPPIIDLDDDSPPETPQKRPEPYSTDTPSTLLVTPPQVAPAIAPSIVERPADLPPPYSRHEDDDSGSGAARPSMPDIDAPATPVAPAVTCSQSLATPGVASVAPPELLLTRKSVTGVTAPTPASSSRSSSTMTTGVAAPAVTLANSRSYWDSIRGTTGVTTPAAAPKEKTRTTSSRSKAARGSGGVTTPAATWTRTSTRSSSGTTTAGVAVPASTSTTTSAGSSSGVAAPLWTSNSWTPIARTGSGTGVPPPTQTTSTAGVITPPLTYLPTPVRTWTSNSTRSSSGTSSTTLTTAAGVTAPPATSARTSTSRSASITSSTTSMTSARVAHHAPAPASTAGVTAPAVTSARTSASTSTTRSTSTTTVTSARVAAPASVTTAGVTAPPVTTASTSTSRSTSITSSTTSITSARVAAPAPVTTTGVTAPAVTSASTSTTRSALITSSTTSTTAGVTAPALATPFKVTAPAPTTRSTPVTSSISSLTTAGVNAPAKNSFSSPAACVIGRRTTRSGAPVRSSEEIQLELELLRHEVEQLNDQVQILAAERDRKVALMSKLRIELTLSKVSADGATAASRPGSAGAGTPAEKMQSLARKLIQNGVQVNLAAAKTPEAKSPPETLAAPAAKTPPETPAEDVTPKLAVTPTAAADSTSGKKRKKQSSSAPGPPAKKVRGHSNVPTSPGVLEMLQSNVNSEMSVICMSVSEWLLVVCCADCCLYCYDLKSGQLVKKLSNAMSGAKAAVAVICLPLSDPASKAYRLLKKPLIEQLGHFRIVVGGLCGVVRQLNAKNSQRVFPNAMSSAFGVACMVNSRQNDNILIGCRNGAIHVYHPRNGRMEPADFKADSEIVCMSVFKWNGERVVMIAPRSSAPVVRHLKTGNLLLTLCTSAPAPGSGPSRGGLARVTCISNLDNYFCYCDSDRNLYIFDTLKTPGRDDTCILPSNHIKMPTASAFCAVDSRSKILYLASVDGQLGSYDVEKFCFFDYTVLQQMPNKPLTSMILHKDKILLANRSGQVAWQMVEYTTENTSSVSSVNSSLD